MEASRTPAGTPTTPATAPAEAVELEKPNGPVAAGMIAVGVGALVLGLLTTFAESSESFKESIQYNDRVGPLSGKTIWAVAAFVVSWGALAAWWRGRSLAWKTVTAITVILIALGILGTFPTFFQEFAAEE
jgi:hypothetical protein